MGIRIECSGCGCDLDNGLEIYCSDCCEVPPGPGKDDDTVRQIEGLINDLDTVKAHRKVLMDAIHDTFHEVNMELDVVLQWHDVLVAYQSVIKDM